MSLGRACCLSVPLFLTSLLAVGCGSGQKSGRPDIDAIPEEELRGAAVKQSLYEFRAKVRKRGVSAAKADLPDLLESLQGYEKLKVSPAYKDTMKQIVDKVQAMQGDLGGSATKESVTKTADEIGALADKLPGQAHQNPSVE
jgi:hypothetical protein